MQTRQIQYERRYPINATEQCFQALVTVHVYGARSPQILPVQSMRRSTMSFDSSAEAADQTGRTSHLGPGGMHFGICAASNHRPARSPTVRTPKLWLPICCKAQRPPRRLDFQFAAETALCARPAACPARSRDSCLPARLWTLGPDSPCIGCRLFFFCCPVAEVFA